MLLLAFTVSGIYLAGYLKPFLVVVATSVLFVFVVWGIFHLPIFLAGLTPPREAKPDPLYVPLLTILIPAKHEPWVIGRAVEVSLNHLEYPRERKEIVVITEDEETARAALPLASANPDVVKIFYRAPTSIQTKPAALDDAIHFTRGEIVGIFDAEDIPERDVLGKVIPHFKDPKVGAVQGILRINNPTNSWLARMMGLEYAAWFRVTMMGADRLGLFIPLGGTCCFLRRDFLRECGWWDSKNLTEDLEVSVRLNLAGSRIRTVGVRSWEEAPVTLGRWVRQRTRWMRGYIETFLRYLPLLPTLTRRLGFVFGASLMLRLASPFIILLIPLSYFLTGLWFVTDVLGWWMPGLMAETFSELALIPLAFNLLYFGFVVAAIYLEDMGRRNLLWLPVYYAYTLLHLGAVAIAYWQHLTKPVFWAKTEHYGYGVKGINPAFLKTLPAEAQGA